MKSGQSLIILLVFVAVAVTITAASASLAVINSSSSSNIELGQLTYNITESGIENALMRLLRDPEYTGETLTVDDGTATITVAGTYPSLTVVSQGTLGGFSRRIQAVVQFTSGVMSISSWREVY